MLLLYRITPFLIGLVTALGFFSLMRLPFHPFVSAAVALVIVLLLSARLVQWKLSQFVFWYVVGTSTLFLLSSFGFFLFLEQQYEKVTLAVIVALVLFFFSEFVFNYVHLPAKYQAYSIEHLSLVINILTIFFSAAVGYGLLTFYQAPVFLIASLFFLMIFFVFYGTLRVSKIESRKAVIYSITGTIILTELFATMSFLPTGFYTNAAVIALFAYLFVGLVRAHFLDKLTKSVLRRYVVSVTILALFIVGSAQWL